MHVMDSVASSVKRNTYVDNQELECECRWNFHCFRDLTAKAMQMWTDLPLPSSLKHQFLEEVLFQICMHAYIRQRNAIKDLENDITYTVVHTYLMNNWIISLFTYNGFVVW